MNKILNVFSVLLVLSLVVFASCGDSGGDDPGTPTETAQQIAINRLTNGGPWTLGTSGTVTGPNGDVSADFTNFQIVFTATTYTTTGSVAEIWPNETANWSFASTDANDASAFVRGDGVVISSTINESNITLIFTVPETSGRGAGFAGEYTVRLEATN